MLYLLGFILFLVFLFFFLITLAIIMVLGAIAGVVFMYFRATVSYINSVREEVTNPFAKIFTIGTVIVIAILPVALFVLAIAIGIVSSVV